MAIEQALSQEVLFSHKGVITNLFFSIIDKVSVPLCLGIYLIFFHILAGQSVSFR